jgi:predicted amidohydrolase YtcJ
MKRCMAYRSFLDAGIPAAAGSDFSPGPFDPRMAIQGMVTRTGWDGKTWGANQRISVEEALRVNTLNGATTRMRKRSKDPSRRANWRISSCCRTIFSHVDKEKIKDIEIVRTVVGGSHGLPGVTSVARDIEIQPAA